MAEDCPKSILELVERFERNKEQYKHGRFNEAQLRREFLDPFFECLGWDMTNKQGYAEAYKDVIHEDAIKVGVKETTKAPDYCFRIGGVRKFFLEAKKPSVNVKDDPEPAFQLRRYAWSAKLPLSLLSDFEEFAVYDCRIKPALTDKASTARIQYYTYKDYATKWGEIYEIFAKNSILKGSFDKYAESTVKKRGTAEVDESFLRDIEKWRENLAKNIALRNSNISQPALNYTVQQTIDRIIFLRICEDRGVEEYGHLREITQGASTYQKLAEWFLKCDDKYNSGLFHFRKSKGRTSPTDAITLSVNIDDKPLKEILKSLYYPDSPYEFSVISSEILGQVYEQFLGKVIVLNAKHQAAVEEKPEVRKSGGVYYTPDFIVEYLVKHTLGTLLEGRSLDFAKTLKIVDPACGSGTFLLQAYQYLVDWHLKWYQQNQPNSKAIYQTEERVWKLTMETRKQILVNSMFGVDIDSQAVEVTKLSLLLKVLEGERQLKFYQKHILPDLGGNIKCGNSLVNSDISRFGATTTELESVNPFSWQDEFPKQMEGGGFDVVIGNPPYIKNQLLNKVSSDYISAEYQIAKGNYDIYGLFIERGLKLLSKRGRLGFIIPNKFFTSDYGAELRKLLSEKPQVERIVNFEDAQLFKKRSTYTALVFIVPTKQDTVEYIGLGREYEYGGVTSIKQALANPITFSVLKLTKAGQQWQFAQGSGATLIKRLSKDFDLFGSLSPEPEVFQGLKTSADKQYLLTVKKKTHNLISGVNGKGEEVTVEEGAVKPVFRGEQVRAYTTETTPEYCVVYPYRQNKEGKAVLIDEKTLKSEWPRTWKYLNTCKLILGARDRGKWADRPDWYAYARSQNIAAFLGQKILVPYMKTRLRAAFDSQGDHFFVNMSTGGFGVRVVDSRVDVEVLLALFNSKLWNYILKQTPELFRGGYSGIKKQELLNLPIPKLGRQSPREMEIREETKRLVREYIELSADTSTAHRKDFVQRQQKTLDNQLNKLIYEMFKLTTEEIDEVERRQ